MAARRHSDPRQADLLGWEPPAIVERFDERRLRAADLRGRIARVVAEALAACDLDRDTIAQRMSEYLGEEVTRAMLDAYASPAKEGHTISFVRLLALIEVTGDARPLQWAAELFGRAVIEDRYLWAVEEAILTAKEEELARAKKMARRRWRGGRA